MPKKLNNFEKYRQSKENAYNLKHLEKRNNLTNEEFGAIQEYAEIAKKITFTRRTKF